MDGVVLAVTLPFVTVCKRVSSSDYKEIATHLLRLHGDAHGMEKIAGSVFVIQYLGACCYKDDIFVLRNDSRPDCSVSIGSNGFVRVVVFRDAGLDIMGSSRMGG